MSKASAGDTVKVDCTVRLASNDQSTSQEPFSLEFTLGEGSILPGLEKAVLGMEAGSTKITVVPPADAFGHHKSELIYPVARSQISLEEEIAVGQVLEIEKADGSSRSAKVTEVRPDVVVLDTNHPLAGEELVLEVTLVAIAG